MTNETLKVGIWPQGHISDGLVPVSVPWEIWEQIHNDKYIGDSIPATLTLVKSDEEMKALAEYLMRAKKLLNEKGTIRRDYEGWPLRIEYDANARIGLTSVHAILNDVILRLERRAKQSYLRIASDREGE